MALEDLPRRGIRSYLYERTPTHKHRGIDLGNTEGAPVFAVRPGRVRIASNSYRPGFSGYGAVVVIRHVDGTEALYAHLQRALVREGETVPAGRIIGTMGRTAFRRDDPTALFSTSRAHLHFEVSENPYPMGSEAPRLDPIAYLERTRAVHPLTGSSIQGPAPPGGGWDIVLPPVKRSPAAALALFAAPLLLLGAIALSKRKR